MTPKAKTTQASQQPTPAHQTHRKIITHTRNQCRTAAQDPKHPCSQRSERDPKPKRQCATHSGMPPKTPMLAPRKQADPITPSKCRNRKIHNVGAMHYRNRDGGGVRSVGMVEPSRATRCPQGWSTEWSYRAMGRHMAVDIV